MVTPSTPREPFSLRAPATPFVQVSVSCPLLPLSSLDSSSFFALPLDPGASSEYCGGTYRLSVYQLVTSVASSTSTTSLVPSTSSTSIRSSTSIASTTSSSPVRSSSSSSSSSKISSSSSVPSTSSVSPVFSSKNRSAHFDASVFALLVTVPKQLDFFNFGHHLGE